MGPTAGPRYSHVLALCAAVLLVAAAVAGVVVHQTVTANPGTPQETAEAFMSAGLRQDWRASWELLCGPERLDHGSVDRYLLVKGATAAMVGMSDERVTVSAGDARPHPDAGPEAHLVEVRLARAGETHDLQLVVVEEDGDWRACGQL
ncbi:hypothetical protein [Geodermatophilus sp. DSM 44513]|uniref:hypothetical protein n=1 Tax=Geodermatophilus sp. DSM 44513 TaxID=1528104 RepID=UPI00141367B9|nr:hypothetical protein [Geodermatophilus sp. DSM 44513]WNV74139.1 hypothetical protein RTG05_14200 [Geodermatophilus sp. DSM 44513]